MVLTLGARRLTVARDSSFHLKEDLFQIERRSEVGALRGHVARQFRDVAQDGNMEAFPSLE